MGRCQYRNTSLPSKQPGREAYRASPRAVYNLDGHSQPAAAGIHVIDDGGAATGCI